MIALSILGSATLLFSCKNEPKPTIYDNETLMTESSENRTITMMENGKRSYIFTAPLIEGYSLATNPYQEFRRGIHMTTFSSDSLALVNATVRANYAIYYERQRLWEAKGNVVIWKFNRGEKDTTITDTTEIHTQQLFWNATTEKIYSNVDTKVLQKDGWHFGVGFDADEELKNIHFRKYSSEMEFEMSQVDRKRDTVPANESKVEEPKLPPRPDNRTPAINRPSQPNRPTQSVNNPNAVQPNRGAPQRPGQPNRPLPPQNNGGRPPMGNIQMNHELSTDIEGAAPTSAVEDMPKREKLGLKKVKEATKEVVE